jgi:site-specific DNA-cytosine methylase
MRPKKLLLLSCPARELLAATTLTLRLHRYEVATAHDDETAIRMSAGEGAAFASGVLLRAQPGDPDRRVIHRILEIAAHIPLLLVNLAGDLAPVRYADVLLYGPNTTPAHILDCGQAAVAFAQSQDGALRSSEVMHSLGTTRNATSRNASIVPFTLHESDGTASTAPSTEIAGILRPPAPEILENSSTTRIVQEQGVASPLTSSYGKRIDSSDTSAGPPNLLRSQMAVGRLAPRECEPLQGFPEDDTLVENRGKIASDGPHSKALDNSMAVPVMYSIEKRIAEVDRILRDGLGVKRVL